MDMIGINTNKDKLPGKEYREIEINKPAPFIVNSIGIEFVLIPAGDFWMFSNEASHQKPVHKVTISKPFYLGKYLVTQKEWEILTDDHPSCFKGDDLPVECVTWGHVQEFIRKLNSVEDTDKYRIPSEAEWEYACRAGTSTRYSFGDNESELGEYAWYYQNSEHRTHPVGLKDPNPWGLYDMHGNVWEWCQDRYYRGYAESLSDTSVLEAVGSTGLVLRGGGWVNYPWKCESSSRSSFDPNYSYYSLGFRLLRSV